MYNNLFLVSLLKQKPSYLLSISWCWTVPCWWNNTNKPMVNLIGHFHPLHMCTYMCTTVYTLYIIDTLYSIFTCWRRSQNRCSGKTAGQSKGLKLLQDLYFGSRWATCWCRCRWATLTAQELKHMLKLNYKSACILSLFGSHHKVPPACILC